MNDVPDLIDTIPEEYYQKAEYEGSIDFFSYETNDAYNFNGETAITKNVVVYVPYGYNEETKYDVAYIMHGRHDNEKSFIV